jgi:uncharacterized protein
MKQDNNIEIENLTETVKDTIEEIETTNKNASPENITEFKEIVKDITDNYNVLALKDHVQHQNSSRYAHCEEVAFYTYLICKKLKLDYISAARGAMLHDFYFYNWRNKNVEGQKKFHLLRHPRIALNNALDIFELNELEKDIILKHMWPVTIVPPKFMEGIIVTLVDKYCATKEFFKCLKVKNKLKLLNSGNIEKESLNNKT